MIGLQERPLKSDDDELNPAHRLKTGSSDSPESLQEQEQGGGQPNTQGEFDDEFSKLTNPEHFQKNGSEPTNAAGPRYNANDSEAPRRPRGIRRLARPKTMAIVGGTIGCLIIFFISFTSLGGFELINLRENLLGRGNRFTNSVLQHRRAASFANMLKKMNAASFEQKIDVKAFGEHFERNGFTVRFDDKGKLTEFGFTDSKGKYQKFDLPNGSKVQATKDFFGTGTFGREASRAYDSAVSASAALWRGPHSRHIYRLYSLVMRNWLDDRRPESKSLPRRQQLPDAVRHADVPPAAADATTIKSASQIAQENPSGTDSEGKPIASEVYDTSNDLVSESGVTPAMYRDTLLSNPAAGVEILGGVAGQPGGDQSISETSTNVAAALERGVENLDPSTMATGVLKGSVKGLSVVGALQTACALKGTLNFISNAANVLVSLELARFAVHILSAADYQKAGILSSEGLALLMTWLHSKKGYYGSGGIQQLIGNSAVTVSAASLAKVSVGRGNPGVLGSIAGFVNKVPGMGKCYIINNGFVTAGGFVVGIAAAILSGGTTAVAGAATAVTLSLLTELARQIAVPLLIAASAHMLISGYEDGDFAGELLGAGFGVFAMMIGSGNGMRPSTKAQLSEIEPLIQADERYARSQQSLYERYISPSNSESLVSRVAMAMPKNLSSAIASITSGIQRLFSSITNFGILDLLMPSKVKAATKADQCDDPQVLAHKLAATASCGLIMANSPNLDLAETESVLRDSRQIDEFGYPTSQELDGGLSFAEYIEHCFTGRPGLLYSVMDPEDNGNNAPEDNTCIEAGPSINGDKVGAYERYASWFGYVGDRDSITEHYGADVTRRGSRL